MSGVFITATGTEIGKTYLTCALLHQLHKTGHKAQAIKPIASGYRDTQPESSDTFLLAQAQDLPWNNATADRITPWRFAAPLSPDLAAQQENRHVDERTLLSFCIDACASPGITLIEGAGGAMSPLTSQWLNADLIARLGIPALLIAGGYLGSISHCLATAESLLQRHIPLLGIILNESPGTTMPRETIVPSLQRFVSTSCPILSLRQDDRDVTLSFLVNTLIQPVL